MDFLNVGGLELLFLLALAVVLVGPQKAVELANQVGSFVASMRRTLNSVKDDLQAQVNTETVGLKQIDRDLRETVDQETRVFREAQEMLREATEVTEDISDNSSGRDVPTSRLPRGEERPD
jgi:Sec-independent protein translocase protein TatA